MKRKINEQQNIKNQGDYNKLKIALEKKCYPDTAKEVKLRVYNDKDIIHYKNVRDEDVVMFADMTAKNLKTGKTAKWTCEALSKIENKRGLLSKFGIPEQNKCNNLQKITQNIVKLIEQGYKSNWFNNWGELISSYSDECGVIDFVDEDILKQSIELPLTSDEKSQYTTVNWFKDVYNLDNGLQVLKPNVVQTTTGVDQSGCSNIVTNYLVAALRNKAFGDRLTNLNQEKPKVQRCLRGKEMDNFSINTSDLEQRVGAGRKNNSLRGVFSGVGNTMSNKEIRRILSGKKGGVINTEFMISENKNISKVIKESLIKLSEEKNTLLVEENKIISTRINYLFENNFPKNKKDEVIFADKLINEMVLLNSQGLNETLISENILQSIAGFFGKGAGNVIEVIKERFALWFLKKLGLSEDSFLTNLIKITVGNISLKDIGKLTKCDYWVDVLGKSIPETLKAYLLKKAGFDNALTDVIRNAFADYFDESTFGTSLKSGLRSFVCPKLKEAESKVDDLGKDLKSKIVSA